MSAGKMPSKHEVGDMLAADFIAMSARQAVVEMVEIKVLESSDPAEPQQRQFLDAAALDILKWYRSDDEELPAPHQIFARLCERYPAK